MATRDASTDKALRWLGKFFLEGIETIIGNMKTLNITNAEWLQWPGNKTFLQRDDGLRLRFVGLDKNFSRRLE